LGHRGREGAMVRGPYISLLDALSPVGPPPASRHRKLTYANDISAHLVEDQHSYGRFYRGDVVRLSPSHSLSRIAGYISKGAL
jgi:hypothetical protein